MWNRFFSLAFALSAVLAGVAGILLGGLSFVKPLMGDGPLIKAMIVIILGGLGQYRCNCWRGVCNWILRGHISSYNWPVLDTVCIVFIYDIGAVVLSKWYFWGGEIVTHKTKNILFWTGVFIIFLLIPIVVQDSYNRHLFIMAFYFCHCGI